ncbi:unnamed protein product [Somion occarium]|uniref:Enhancer of mRNA-decapping protein 4 n=1 Tax=Somion occarium TaxID=3059160 RepID=A0ABP1DBF3_9APHY
MDPINNRDNLFSRGPSPPPQIHQQFQPPLSQFGDPHVSPQGSIRDNMAASTAHLDSLFHNLASPPQASHSSPQPSNAGSVNYPNPQDVPVSGPATPASVTAGSIASSGSAPSNPAAERQNIPTPPGSAPRSAPSSGENQGKMLLEQLMSGNTQKYNPEPQPAPQPHPGPGGPSPTYSLAPVADSQSHYEGDHTLGDSSFTSQEFSRDTAPAPQPTQQGPPSPARRSMFDFVSPFDALAGSTSQAKRKPAPSQAASSMDEPAWNPPPVDSKRKSVENLMDQLTRGQAPLSAPNQPPPMTDTYAPTDESAQSIEPAQQAQRAPRPLPPQPSQQSTSPRSSPPKAPAQQRQQRRGASDSPGGQAPDFSTAMQRDKESSPLPTSTYTRRKGRASPIIHMQSLIIDVTRPLEEIQAPRDGVKSTAIALVRVDSTFLPGTTIGATHWVAYAMTKGRVRVISRSSGDRTLLQLPQIFPPTVAVTDMSVHGNRLAGVTSDGGFVVWELPEVIRDDVPGTIMLCVLPTADMDPLRAVKWHPQDPDIVTVTSDNNIYLINIADAAHIFGGQPISQTELHRVARVWSVASPIVAFDYDIPRSAIGTISEDSTLTMWNIRDQTPVWSNKIRGDDLPSSLMFLEKGVVVGRKNGTVFQLLPIMRTDVHSTIKFVNGNVEDPDMFGHANYDSRIQTLWIANNRRDSMFAFKIDFTMRDYTPRGEEPLLKSVMCDQVVEFSGPKPTIHFVILTADADPTGEEAHAACVAAKVPPGELALVAFSVHSSGVDQILIRKEWYTSAFARATSKFPWNMFGPVPKPTDARIEMIIPPGHNAVPHPEPRMAPAIAPPRNIIKTPPSEELETAEASREEGRAEGKGKGKGKNVNFKDKDDSSREKDVKGKGVDNNNADSLVKEIRKVEESIHTRIGRLISKELDKQHQRLEDARANEQAADFVRQEKILKLISTELTKNTTRVVEMAVKAEVQNSVLPSLENITKNEVKSALNNQVAKGLGESMKQHIPVELERMLLRPEVANHMARTFSATVAPIVERQVKETVSKVVVPTYTQQTAAMHQELSGQIHNEIQNLKKDVLSWQNEALHKQEVAIRDLEQSVRLLSDQVKYMGLHVTAPSSSSNIPIQRSSPAPSTGGNLAQLLRHPPLGNVNQPSQANYPQVHGPYPPQQQPQPPLHGPWFGPSIAAPQASHPAAPPPVPSQQPLRTPPPNASEEWDDMYLQVLASQDSRQLRELLARSNPDVVMPMNGPSPLSQAVVLTLVHRLTQLIGETPPVEEAFKTSIWWLHRASSTLNTLDPLISPYVARVLPSVLGMLNTTKQRLAILPGGPSPDAAHNISNIQEILSQKPL